MADESSTSRENTSAAANAIFQLFQQWLTRVEGKIDTLTGRLEGKADRAEVADIAARLDSKVSKAEFERLQAKVEGNRDNTLARIAAESDRIDALDKRVGIGDQQRSDRTEWIRWVAPLVATVGIVVVGLLQLWVK